MQKKVITYPEFSMWADVFIEGGLDVMIVEGSAGSGKSSLIRDSLRAKKPEDYSWIEGRISAVCLYEKLYHARDLPVYIDDVDGLYRDKECINILKCLCQTWEEKTIMWNTKASTMSAPREFKTKSKVCIITNCWKSLNRHVGAVEDRGLLIMFTPPAQEIHRFVGEDLRNNPGIFDQEVYNFLGDNLHLCLTPSLRYYRNAIKLKELQADWTDVLIETFGVNDNEICVLKLRRIKGISENDRAKRFAAMLGKSERTYWRTVKDMERKPGMLPE